MKITNSLDPDLEMFRGRQYPIEKSSFGIFSDSAPDRWGRTLMNRREACKAKEEGRKPNNLNDCDYLLGVDDTTRMGALRFSLEEGGPFLSVNIQMAVPPWATLRDLEEAFRRFEIEEGNLNEKYLRQLLAPGSSLGGARPKASVQNLDGTLWIAKFPSRNDDYDIGEWEKVTHDLANLCGLHVPESKLEKYSKLGSTFLVKRFDREGQKRIHFASAMTLLGKTDGASSTDGTSYLDIAGFIKAYGNAPKKDLMELWMRVVFSMVVSNTDDHLRNHGFLLTKEGWSLSPLYDVNPIPYGDQLSLNVTKHDNRISLELAIEMAQVLGIQENESRKKINEIKTIVRNNWNTLAEQYGISHGSIEAMRPAFTLAYQKDHL